MRTFALVAILFLLIPLARPAAAQTTQTPPAAQTPRPMTLAELVATGEQRNPTITVAIQSVAVAEANVALARAGQGPTVTASGTAATAGGGTAASTFSSGAALTASYQVYNSGQTTYAVRQAEANLSAARLTLAATRQDVAQNIGLAYATVLRAEIGVELNRQQVVQNQELLRLARGQFQAGVAARADVVNAEANLAVAEGNLLVAQGTVEQFKAVLNTTLGLEATVPIGVALPPLAPELTVAQGDLAGLVEQRPEVQRALANIQAAEAGVALAQAGGGLTIALNGGVGQTLSPSTSGTYVLGATVSLPVYTAGKIAANVAAAQANVAAARAQLDSTRLTVLQQSLAGWLAVRNALARIPGARAGLASAEESLRLSQGRYAAGATTIIEVTTAQTTLEAARVTLANAVYDQLLGVIQLRYALGRSVVNGAI